jgi:serine/threonine protein kinase
MEYADGGDLDQMLDDLKENKKFITEEEIMKYFVQICLALK